MFSGILYDTSIEPYERVQPFQKRVFSNRGQKPAQPNDLRIHHTDTRGVSWDLKFHAFFAIIRQEPRAHKKFLAYTPSWDHSNSVHHLHLQANGYHIRLKLCYTSRICTQCSRKRHHAHTKTFFLLLPRPTFSSFDKKGKSSVKATMLKTLQEGLWSEHAHLDIWKWRTNSHPLRLPAG